MVDDFVAQEHCRPIGLLNTHGHLDHIFGVNRGRSAWGVSLYLHADDVGLLLHASAQAQLFGLEMDEVLPPEEVLHDGQVLSLNGYSIEVLHTPGHSPGGVCFYVREAGLLFSGDTLFQGSIGRTDLQGGDFGVLIQSIQQQLLVLPDDTVVLPGHGPQTTIGQERRSNPFL